MVRRLSPRTMVVIVAALALTLGAATQSSATAKGQARWLYRSTVAARGATNVPGLRVAHPSAMRWTPAHPAGVFNILVYTDDFYHPFPNTYVDQALQNLGLPYTAHYDQDFAGFEADLTSGTAWDLVIFADDNYTPNASTLRKLNNYITVLSGKEIFDSWTVHNHPNWPIYRTLGFHMVDDDADPPDNQYWWDASNPIFAGVPQFTQLTAGRYGVYGQRGVPHGTPALSGITLTTSTNNNSGCEANGGRTIFKGFMDGQNDADLDGDGVPDGVELWTNMISVMLGL